MEIHLIDDPEFTDKPFKWEMEFQEIFESGGFDIVIGNPPYVRMEQFKDIKTYLKKNYLSYMGRADLYVYFFEKGLNILRKGGYFSFISSDKFIGSNYGKLLRKFVLKYQFLKYIEFKGKGVFKDATVDPCIIVLQKHSPLKDNTIKVNDKFEIPQLMLDSNIWNFQNPEIMNLKSKIEEKGIKISEINNLNISWGLRTGYNKAYILTENLKNKLINEYPPSSDVIKPILRGKDIKKNKFNYENLFVIIIKKGDGPKLKDIYPNIYEYLKQYEKNLKNRGQVKNGQHHWLELDNAPNISYLNSFKKPKLIYPEISTDIFTVFDNNKFYANNKCFIISSDNSIYLKYLSSLISSKTLNFFFKLVCNPIARTSINADETPRYNNSKIYIEQLPIYPLASEQQKSFVERVDLILNLNKSLQEEENSFKDWLMHTFNIEKLSQKLEKYYKLYFDDFLNELEKKKINVKSRDNYQTLKKEFNESINVINPLLQQIKETDSEIDQMVYDLYGLTPEEIKIIEEMNC